MRDEEGADPATDYEEVLQAPEPVLQPGPGIIISFCSIFGGHDRVRYCPAGLCRPFKEMSGCEPSCVANPDPQDQYVFGTFGSGSESLSTRYGSGSCSGSFYSHDFLSLENDVNVASKSNKKKT